MRTKLRRFMESPAAFVLLLTLIAILMHMSPKFKDVALRPWFTSKP